MKRTAAEVSVRQIEIPDDRCAQMLDALRVWRRFAGLPVLMVLQVFNERIQLKIIKGRAVSDLVRDSQLFVGYAFTHGLPPVARGESDTS